MVRTVVIRAVSKAFQSVEFQKAVEQAVKKCVAEPHIVRAVIARKIDDSAFTVPRAKFFKHEGEKAPSKR